MQIGFVVECVVMAFKSVEAYVDVGRGSTEIGAESNGRMDGVATQNDRKRFRRDLLEMRKDNGWPL